MKKRAFLGVTLLIWFCAVFSLIAIRYLIRRPARESEYLREARAYYDGLGPATKEGISILETAIIRLSDGGMRTIGGGFEQELYSLISGRHLKARKVDFFIENPIALERRMMAGEAFKTLNNAEKKCYVDGFGVILFRNGSYEFICDEKTYQEYEIKYGTECKPCEEIKKRSSSVRGGGQ